MQPHDTPSRSRIGGASNYVIAIVLLVAMIGGLAWVAQYLPSRTKNTQVEDPTKDSNKKPLVSFNSVVAQWGDKKADREGYEKAKKVLQAAYIAARDIISVKSDENERLKALQDFRNYTIH